MSALRARSSSVRRRAVVALGSNLGSRESHLQHAVVRLRDILSELRVSRFLETAPEGVPDEQPAFLNGVALGWSGDEPQHLLNVLQIIEHERGRERPFPGAARTLDLDLILVGDLVIDAPPLLLPHPRFRNRRFVLAPLAEIAPDLVDPVTGRSIQELLDGLTTSSPRW